MLIGLGIRSESEAACGSAEQKIDLVRMVLTGQVGPQLVSLINEHGHLAVGLSGEDGGLLTAERTLATVDGEQVDVGLVGEVVAMNQAPVMSLLRLGYVPVVSTVAPDASGRVHNLNADTAAAALAVALGAAKFVVLAEVEGLLRDWPHPESLMQED